MRINYTASARRPYVAATVAILAGIVLVTWPGDVLDYLIQVLGIALCVAGGVTLALAARDGRAKNILFMVTVASGVVFGALLCLLPGRFTNSLIYLLGILLALDGAKRIVYWLYYIRRIRPFFFLMPPLITLAIGVLLLAAPAWTRETFIILVGAALMLTGLQMLAAPRPAKIARGEEETVDAEHEEL